MRIVYFGTAEFAVPALERIASRVVAVVSQPDRPRGRQSRVLPSPVSERAIALGLPLLRPEKARDPAFIDELKALDADVFVVAAYGQILRQVVLDIPKRGCFNLHGSILPAYRGAAPIQRCLMNGDAETGVTLMLMDAGMDTGDMVAVARTPIDPAETAGELTPRLARVAADLIEAWLPRIAAGDFPREPQDDSQATHASKLTREDGFLELSRPSYVVFNQFRGVTPNPGASIGDLLVHDCAVAEASGQPGTIVALKPHVVVACGEGGLALITVQAPGRKAMSGRDWANGARMTVGSRLL